MHGVFFGQDSSLRPATPPFIGSIEGYLSTHQELPSSELIAWDSRRELFVMRLGVEESAAVALPASPYGGQMGYRRITDRRYQLWGVGPHGPVLMCDIEYHKEAR